MTVTVRGDGSPTGEVKVTASTRESCGPVILTGNTGHCSITFSTPGARTVTATYSGDINFNGSSAMKEQIVEAR